jgi:peptidoglycan/LPS O-acetylase OafA/YrhL
MQQSLPALTGVRALAALGVVLFHFTGDTTLAQILAAHEGDWLGFRRLFASGYLGVDLFFVLSGFIIHHVYRSKFATNITSGSYAAFLRYRFARIWPVHIVTMAAMLALYAIAISVLNREPSHKEAYSIPVVVTNIAMLHAWIGYPSPNIPAWSISAEWFAYVLFPFMCMGLLRVSIGAKVGLIIAAFFVVELWGNTHPLLRITPEFMIGMVLRDLLPPQPRPAFIGLMAVGGLLASIYLIQTEALALKVALLSTLIVALTSPTDWLTKVLSTTPLVYLGEISYSTYMTHGIVWSLVLNVVRMIAPEAETNPAWVVWPSIVLVLGASALTYHMIELPARRMLRHVSWGRNTAIL